MQFLVQHENYKAHQGRDHFNDISISNNIKQQQTQQILVAMHKRKTKTLSA
jgi:hypothetical protein